MNKDVADAEYWRDRYQRAERRVKLARTQTKAAIERGAADHAVAEAARILAAGPDSTAWERLYAALAVADKAGRE